MSKKGFFYFALGAVAGAAGLYYLKKNGGLHFSVDIEASDNADVDLDMEDELNEEFEDELEVVGEDTDCCCTENGAEPEV